jgi:hypothetical protein
VREERERRLALNEALFREINEAVEELSEGWFEPDEAIEFRCECAKTGCEERVLLTRNEYLEVRSRPHWFVLVPGHEEPDLERVLRALRDAYVVEKTGAGRAVAEETDPTER